MNISLLGILIWHLLCDKHKFWVSILSHKYIKNRDILNVNHSKGASYVWKSIVKALGYLKEGFHFAIRNGETPLWQYDWMGLGPLGEVFYIHVSDINKQVKHLWVDGRWSFDGIVTMLLVEVKDYIRAIPFAASPNDDC